ncbi:MAG: PepSY domain-containing protein [Flavobacteriaceae bacterium]
MRTYHRYLGFFLAGVMAVYALSGIVLIFRKTDTFKKEVAVEVVVAPQLDSEALGKALKIKELQFDKENGDMAYFQNGGSYNRTTGEATYTTKKLPFIMEKMTKLHKATTKSPIYWLNIFFGLSLLFFVISSFWMFLPHSSIFKKGLYFSLAGLVLTIIILFV